MGVEHQRTMSTEQPCPVHDPVRQTTRSDHMGELGGGLGIL